MTDTLLASRYRLQARLGQGGMGVVHQAIDETTGARVAVKLVHAEIAAEVASDLLGEDPADELNSRLARFFREAKASAAIEGPHVARTLDFGTDPATGQAFIVMELLEGEDLQSALKRVQQLPPDVALRIVAQACRGLAQAHRARVIHRDIKPANLFLARSPSGEVVVKILDFGIAKIRPEKDQDGETTGLTRTGNMLGSPKYMSPEQARGSRAIDHRSDLWSLGVVLFRMLTGHTPHEDVTAIGEFIIVLCTEPPEPVQSFAPWVTEELAAIVEDALQIDADERFESADAMLEAITALLPNGEALRAEEIAPLNPSVSGAMSTPTPSVWPGGPMSRSRSGSGSGSGSGSRSKSSSRSGSGSRSRSDPGSRSGATPSGSSTSLPPSEMPTIADVDPETADSSTRSSMANTQPEAARLEPASPTKRRTLLAVVGAAAVIGIGLAIAFSRGTSSSSDRPAPAATDASALSASADAVRSASLVVLPDDARVEIDGVAASMVDGVVQIAGKLGSAHRVRITKDGQEKNADVRIGPNGAEPPKVELELPEAPRASGAPAASGAPTAVAAKAGASSHAAPKKSGEPDATAPKPPASTAPSTSSGPRKPLIPERFE